MYQQGTLDVTTEVQAAPKKNTSMLKMLAGGVAGLMVICYMMPSEQAAVVPQFTAVPSNYRASTSLNMASDSNNINLKKAMGAGVIAASLFGAGTAANAEAGAAPKQSYFGGGNSSPFTFDEKREDKIYSPYSPFGDGSAAVYKDRKGNAEEQKFWQAKFTECKKRVDKVPGFTQKKQWFNVQSTLKTYAYNTRESMLRLASYSKNPKEASAAAKVYFDDLNDMDLWARQKQQNKLQAAYDKSLSDLSAYENLIK